MPRPLIPETLTSKTVRGAAWSGAGRAGVQLFALIGTLIVARILSPRIYGIVGIARVVSGFVEIFRDLGTASAIVQRKHLSEELLSSVFWANILLGCAAMALCWALAPALARFYSEPLVAPALRGFAACFVIVSLSAVPSALLNREMSFRAISIVEVGTAACSTAVTIAAALLGAGLWSLVIGALANVTTAAILFWRATAWRPRTVLRWSELRPILGYSLNLSGYNAVTYFSRNADNLIVGKILGAQALGYYQIAYNLMLYSVQSISVVAGRVLFPALVRLRDDHPRLRAAYTKGASVIAAIVFPVMLGVAALAEPFVRVVLGPRWLPAISVLLCFAPVGLMQCILITAGNIYTAKDRTALMFRWAIFSAALYVVSFFVGVRWGVSGVAAAYLVANTLLFWPALRLPLALVDLPVTGLLRLLWPVLANSITMALLVFGAGQLVHSWNPYAQLAALTALGAVTYSGLMLWWEPAAARNLLAAIRA